MPRPIPSDGDRSNEDTFDLKRRRLLQAAGAISFAGVGVGNAGAAEDGEGDYQAPPEEWPERVEPSPEGLSREPPEDATILWNGDDVTLDQWEHTDASPINGEQDHGDPAAHTETDEYFQIDPGQGDFRPEIDGIGGDIGDCHLHLEWATPEWVEGDGQGRGNSGLFMMERYEIQILDNYENETSASNEAGAYYAADATRAMPIRPQGEWNEYDIIWRGPRITEDDEVIRLPQLTVIFNGVVVKQHYNVPGPNWAGIHPFTEGDHQHFKNDDGEWAEEWPFYLQDHGGGNDVARFRNVWYRDLAERPVMDYEHPDDIPEYDTSHGGNEYPDMVDAGGPGTTGAPPEDADVLIDDELTIEPEDGDWVSEDAYGDAQIHVEYKIPEGEGSGRGSSGVLMMGNYEINILDTSSKPAEAEEWAGAYTHQSGPHNDAVREPGEWQQLDIAWQSPRFEGDHVAQPAQVTAFLNGVAVQTRLLVHGPNDGDEVERYETHVEEPLRLREDGSEISFRNTWIRPEASNELFDPEVTQVPYGLDAGGVETDGNVVIDGLQFDRSPDDSEYVSVTRGAQTSAPPNPEELEFEGTYHDRLYASEINGAAPGAEATVPVVGSEVSAYVTENDLGEAGSATEEDYGHFGFEIDAPRGRYELTLHFSDWPDVDDERIQDVYVQDELVFEAFTCEPGVAQPETFEVDVTDGPLTIDLEVHSDSDIPEAKINGLELHRIEEPLWKGAE